jgi:D-alanyl-lipoteichoic acid acyltransferase DltB (MBOAT superfamily)
MVFDSWLFAAFFVAVTAIYYVLPPARRWAWLLVASCGFYMAYVPPYILILAFTIAVDYVAGLKIAGSEGAARRRWLLASVAANLGVLGLFKYFDFLGANLAALLHVSPPVLDLVLPIGLSFHVFQSMAYTIDVYRGKFQAERHAGIFALYVMFYPQLVAGPIERPAHMIPQFHQAHAFEYERVMAGLTRMGWGCFKKLVVADRLALAVDRAFMAPGTTPGPALLLAAVLYAFQIYCDFSGYCDIALGAAQVMGFELTENFQRPYFAGSVSEFWRRWHITLSGWFRDYVYIPLGGNRVHAARNVMLVFAASGLWHGANWTFVAWGAMHGLALLVERWLKRPFGRLATFAWVTLAWVVFRCPTLGDAQTYLWRMTTDLGWQAWTLHGLGPARDLQLGLGGILVVLGVDAAIERGLRITAAPRWVRVASYYGLTFALLLASVHQSRAFIYFQF